MKIWKRINIMTLVLLINLSSIAIASDQSKAIDHSGHIGEKIHESIVEGYTLAYHLLDLPDTDAHHLMAYITDAQGNEISKAKVGYLIQGPDGVTQKIMAMVMKNAFGGNVNFTVKGKYNIN